MRTPEQFERWSHIVAIVHNHLVLACDLVEAEVRPWENTRCPSSPNRCDVRWPKYCQLWGPRPAHPNLVENRKATRQVFDIAQSYTEISPSGKGLHIFLRGNLPEENGKPILGMKSDKGEMYAAKHYITITGNIIGEQRDIRADQEAINRIYALLKPPSKSSYPTRRPPDASGPPHGTNRN